MFDYDNPNDESSIYNFEITNEDREVVVKEFLEEAKKIEWTDSF